MSTTSFPDDFSSEEQCNLSREPSVLDLQSFGITVVHLTPPRHEIPSMVVSVPVFGYDTTNNEDGVEMTGYHRAFTSTGSLEYLGCDRRIVRHHSRVPSHRVKPMTAWSRYLRKNQSQTEKKLYKQLLENISKYPPSRDN